MKICAVGAGLLHADSRTGVQAEQTDMTNLIYVLRDFTGAPRKCSSRFGSRARICCQVPLNFKILVTCTH